MFTLRKIPRFGGREYLDRYGRGDQEKQVAADLGKGTWRFRLHHFLGFDDAGHHNHPFEWALSINLSALWGACYTEEVLHHEKCNWGCCNWKEIKTRRVCFFNWIPYGKYHRITELHKGLFGVWTLFITGPRVSSWGFWIAGRGHVDHVTYKKEQGQ